MSGMMGGSTKFIGFFATKNGAQSVGNGSWAYLTSFTEEFDEGDCFDASTGIFTAPEDGIYQGSLQARIACNANFNGYLKSRLVRSAQGDVGENIISCYINSSSVSYVPIAQTFKLVKGQTVQAQIYQYTGATKSISSGLYTSMSIKKVG